MASSAPAFCTKSPLRVALFTDTFEQINGVALTTRQFVDFARRHDYPLLCVRGAERTAERVEGSVIHHELSRSRFSIPLDRGLLYDPVLWRTGARIASEVARFKPDIIHIVSPGDVSTVGVYVARKLKIPLAISWHTNLHEFAAMRLGKTLGWAPESMRTAAVRMTQVQTLRLFLSFYRLGRVLYAPNEELVSMLREHTGKPVHLMERGIDTKLFHPAKRTLHDGVLRIGYVGRMTPEKSVRFFRELEAGLEAAGVPPFRFLMVGDGSELEWLRRQLRHADFRGIRRGEELSQDYANMDVFAFPSRTDTFGNVVLEAFASGVPAVVTGAGGPKYIVGHGSGGFVAPTDTEFIESTARLLRDAALRQTMAQAAREQACGESWDEVFGKVYDGYLTAVQ
jgi:phosphatidylinositol alpha 1,6-mannosyltransferase